MLIFDAHLDLAWNAIDWNRDLLRPCDEIRRQEKDAGMTQKARGENTVSFPDLRRGRVCTFIATLLARLMRPGPLSAVQRYTNMAAAYAAAYGQLAYYRALEYQGHLRFIKDWPTLDAHTREWKTAGASPATRPLGYILSMEGADPVLFPEQIQEWWDVGLRIIGPAHYGVSPYAHGTGTEGGLFRPGKPLLREMERVGMILDVTHLADRSFDEAMDSFGGKVLASHHNCRALVPDQRQLTDSQIRLIVSRGGVIGAAFDAWMLHPNYVRGQTVPREVGVDIARVVDGRAARIWADGKGAGNAMHSAIGSDLDGGFGREQSPHDLDTIADLQVIPDILRKRGYSETDIEGIMYDNWLRFFRDAWEPLAA